MKLKTAFATVLMMGAMAPAMALEGESYQNPTPGEFPVVAWFSVKDSVLVPERFDELREAGFNLSLSHLADADAVQRALDASVNTGVKNIVMCPEMNSATRQTVERFKNHPQTAMWYLRDEPTTHAFGELAALRDSVYAADGTHPGYLNLLPEFVEASVLGAKDYEDYVQRYVDEIRLPLITYDLYPIRADSLGLAHVSDQLYSNLHKVRNVSLRNNIPFWAFYLATPHANYPNPRQPHVNLEAFAALAYGAQGLQCFTYWQPVQDDYAFYNAPIDKYGKRTDTYYLVKELNKEIHALSPIFLGAEVLSVGFLGEKLPEGTEAMTALPDGIRDITFDKPYMLASHLKGGDGNTYLLLVNGDIHSAACVNLEGAGNVLPKSVMPDGTLISTTPTTFVAPGGHMLLRL